MAGALIVAVTALFKRKSPGFDPDDPDNWTGLDYVHERVLDQLGRQEVRWKEVDDRLRFLLGVIGIVVAAGVGFMRSSVPAVGLSAAAVDPLAVFMPSWLGSAVIVAIILYLIAGAMAGWAYRPQKFDRPPIQSRCEPGTSRTTRARPGLN